MNQTSINTYFSTEWRGNFSNYLYSGYQLLEHITENDTVLDVGCGDNYFKGLIKNLVGIDPANDAADVKTTIEDYAPDQLFSVALCLGSVNFGDEQTIAAQISKVISLLEPKARIFWRCNPGLSDHGTEGCKGIQFFPWSHAMLAKMAAQFGFELSECRWDSYNRIYSVWTRG